ncbi:MAG: tetratricopeptide repeat protein [Bradyrhizobium sp.]|uniref:tetratricopeptide repeat protein n=1 Tax=Bradyrhizobium sp. TaxID=376 RepID=UPI001D7BEAE8|nr:tetratricopeptide repeat protein [Bradyrhizobium sp.]MBV9564411.1 tetratricopeptide repeat protein [Bradyrhizobium sp.]
MNTATQQLFVRAIDAQRKGAVEDAKALYQELLRVDPSHAAACGNLGIIAVQQGDLIRAETLFRREIEFEPANSVGHTHLGLVLQQQGRWSEAVAAHRQAVKLDPKPAQAHLALGNALKGQGRLPDAAQCFLAALALRPDYAEAHNNVGVVLQMQGRPAEAAAAYRNATSAQPAYPEAWFNLGVVQHQLRDLDAAEAAYRRVITLDPRIAAAHSHLSAVLREQGRLEEALASCERAIELQPDDVDAVNNAGILLQEQGRPREAVELYRPRLRPGPMHADLYNNMGTALLAEGRAEEARAAFEQALAARPEFPEACYNLGNAWRELGGLAPALAAWRRGLELRPGDADAFSQLAYHRALACDWDEFDADQQRLLALARSGRRVPPFYLFFTKATAADQLRCAEQWSRPFQAQGTAFEHRRRKSDRRIRLGYLSGDLHQHATSQLVAGLFEGHDRHRFEIYAYSYGPDDGSAMRARLENAFDRFVDVAALAHRDAARRIHADEIDILIDLKGHTHGARPAVAAHRPAPVQVSYLGFPATMGADFIDYIMVDRFVLPEHEQAFFSERLVHLPNCYQVNDRPRELSAPPTRRSDCGLPEQGLVFCCFNNSYKLSPPLFDVWMRLLHAAPGSVLWLLAANELAERHLRVEAGRRGVDPARLIFAPRLPLDAHLERHRHADLFLDTLPCNAHTTASDALRGGLPILTCAGETFAGRVAGSLLTAIGMRELVTTSLEDYERKVLEFIRAPDQLVALRQRIERARDGNSPFDLASSTAAIEAAYERMWQRWLAGEKPAAFAVGNV